MTTRTEIRTEISRIPMAKRHGALKTFMDNTGNTASVEKMNPIEVIDHLTDLVCGSRMTLDQIKQSAPFTGLASATPSDNARIDATASIASRAESTALDALQQISRVGATLGNDIASVTTNLHETTKVLNDISKRLDHAESAIGQVKVDESAVNAAIAQVVADAFAPIKQAVEKAGAQQVVADIASVFIERTAPCKDVFGIDVTDAKGNPLSVNVWNNPNAPKVDPNFVWTEGILKHLLLADDKGNNVWFGGEKGTGKSETARQFAARTGRAFKRVNFHKYTTTEDYAGAVGLKDGNTAFVKGDFLSAFTSPSTVILLDEITNADPAELATLNGFLEPNSAVSYGGSVHQRASGVLVFAADNTLGSGDDTGRYAGTRSMNASLVDRFAQVIRFDYLPIAQEVKAVMHHTGCSKELATHVLKAIHVCRAKVATADIVDAPSIRSVIAFINALPILGVDEAWKACVADRQPTESATALEAIKLACIDKSLINNNI